MKAGKAINQRTFMHDEWTWTTIWGLTKEEEGVRLDGHGKREKQL